MTPEDRHRIKLAIDARTRELVEMGRKRRGFCVSCGVAWDEPNWDCYTCRMRVRGRESQAKKAWEAKRSAERKRLRVESPEFRAKENASRQERKRRRRELEAA